MSVEEDEEERSLENAAYQIVTILKKMEKKLEQIGGLTGPAGPQGSPGPKGEKGETGPMANPIPTLEDIGISKEKH